MDIMSADPARFTVGFAGLGNMGFPMAGHLIARGYRLIAYDINPEAVRRIQVDHGASTAETPQDLMARSDVVILMLPDGKIVRRFLMGEEGEKNPPAAAMKSGGIVIDMSSSAPMGTRDLGDELKRFGLLLVDAPVSGGVRRARTAALAIMVGGEEETVKAIEPLLSSMGNSIIHVGPLGAGHAMKALNNYVSATGLVAACEALRVAQDFGIDGQKAIDVLNSSTGRNNSTETKLAQFVLSGAFNSGFSLGLMRKDLATALDLAHELGAEMLVADTVVALWTEAEQTLGGRADHTEIARLLRPRNPPASMA